MNKCFLTGFVIFFLSVLPAVSSEPVYSIDYSPRAEPGSIYPVRFQEQWMRVHEELKVILVDSQENVVVKGRSFLLGGRVNSALAASRGDGGEAVVLIAVPNTLSPGEYELRFFGISGDDADQEKLIMSDKVDVVERSFESMNIALKESLTKMRRSPNPKKTKQAREIQRIYGTFNPESVYDGERWIVPLEEYKYITSSFGDRRIYEYSDGDTARSIHNGVDLAAPEGTPVKASAGGRVAVAEDRIISGKSVVIEHLPGMYSIYFHLDSLDVEKGDWVEQGERIGTVGETGLATGSHLHWEVRLNGEPMDPWELTKTGIFEIISITEGPLRGHEDSEGG
ncbi:MAG: M23 family metallopeptidase [Spirochaetia bacterium]